MSTSENDVKMGLAMSIYRTFWYRRARHGHPPKVKIWWVGRPCPPTQNLDKVDWRAMYTNLNFAEVVLAMPTYLNFG